MPDDPTQEPEELDVTIATEVEQETSRALNKETRQVLFAVLLVKEGYTASPVAFEHHHGYFNALSK